MKSNTSTLACVRVRCTLRWTRSIFSAEKKLSIAELSQTCALTSLIRMMQQLLWFTSAPHGHHQCVSHQLRRHARLHRPTYYAPGVQVQHRRHIQPALSCPDVCEVSHPFLIRCIGLERAIKDVVRNRAALPTIHRQPSSARPSLERLPLDEPFNSMKNSAVAQL
jgi:hypothetical protein